MTRMGLAATSGRAAMMRWLAVTSAAVATGQAVPALAQGVATPSVQELAQAEARPYNIPTLPLTDAAALFGRQSGLQVTFSAGLDSGQHSAPVAGTMTADQALRTMLAGTGVAYRFAEGRTVVLSRAIAPGASSDGAMMLPPVSVESRRGEVAGGPVKGYVATRSATGSKTDTPLIETPQSISVITRDQMDARGITNVTEALNYTAGIYTQPFGADQRYDQAYIRGFTATNYGDYRDGLRQPVVNFSGFRSEPYGLERIEVLKGPSSVLYGQAQPGGIINRVSKLPTEAAFREVQIQGGTHDRIQGSFDLSGPLDNEGKYLGRIVGLVRDADHPLYDGKLPNDRQYIAPSFTWRPTTDTSLTFLASYQRDDTFTFKNYSPTFLPTAFRNGYFGEPNWDRFKQEQTSIGTRFEHRFNETWTVRQNMRYARSDTDFRQMEIATFPNANGDFGRAARRWDEDLRAFTIDNQVQASFATGAVAHTLLVGFDYQHLNWRQNIYLGTVGVPPSNLFNPVYGFHIPMQPLNSSAQQKLDQYGLYVQDQIKIADKWVVTLGGRHDWAKLDDASNNYNPATGTLTSSSNKSNDDKAFSGRAGLIYLSDTGLAPYLSYSESFLPTTGVDRFGNTFDPTRGRQYEAGVKYQPRGLNSFITFSAFHLTQRNVLTPDPANVNFSVQTGEVRSKGIEVEGLASLAEGLDLVAALSFQDVEVTKSNVAATRGKHPLYAPAQTASLWGDYTFPQGPMRGLGFGAGIRYVGETYADTANTAKNSSMTFVDAGVHYDLGGVTAKLEGMRVALNATNLFDRQFDVCSSGSCYVMDGRTVLATLRYRW